MYNLLSILNRSLLFKSSKNQQHTEIEEIKNEIKQAIIDLFIDFLKISQIIIITRLIVKFFKIIKNKLTKNAK